MVLDFGSGVGHDVPDRSGIGNMYLLSIVESVAIVAVVFLFAGII